MAARRLRMTLRISASMMSSETLSASGPLKYVSMMWLRMSKPPETICFTGTLYVYVGSISAKRGFSFG